LVSKRGIERVGGQVNYGRFRPIIKYDTDGRRHQYSIVLPPAAVLILFIRMIDGGVLDYIV